MLDTLVGRKHSDTINYHSFHLALNVSQSMLGACIQSQEKYLYIQVVLNASHVVPNAEDHWELAPNFRRVALSVGDKGFSIPSWHLSLFKWRLVQVIFWKSQS